MNADKLPNSCGYLEKRVFRMKKTNVEGLRDKTATSFVATCFFAGGSRGHACTTVSYLWASFVGTVCFYFMPAVLILYGIARAYNFDFWHYLFQDLLYCLLFTLLLWILKPISHDRFIHLYSISFDFFDKMIKPIILIFFLYTESFYLPSNKFHEQCSKGQNRSKQGFFFLFFSIRKSKLPISPLN